MNNKKLNILVTGCGGDIGQSIGKILNKEAYITAHGCDISDKNAGQFIFKHFFKSVRYDDKDYLPLLTRYVSKNNIDIIIPMAEPELRFFSKNNITEIGGKPLLMASQKAMEIGFDKYKTAQFLKENKLPFPKTQLINEKLTINYPFIIKSKTGSGSAAVYLVENEEELHFYRKKHPDFIVQEYLPSQEGEFTCGVFRDNNTIRTIILKRELTGGYSGYGEVIENKEIESLLLKITKKIALQGSINVQLRLTEKGPVTFEINPRFSSTVLFRHLFGFKDLLWSLEAIQKLPISPYTKVIAGQKFYKGFQEYIA